jgi:Flp pilus assembly protein TadG
MRRLSKSVYRILSRDTGGSEIAEFAVIVPLLFLALMGIFWFGQAFRIYNAITSAARDGVRAAVAPVCTTCAPAIDPSAQAWTVIQNDLNAAHINPAVLAQPAPIPGLCGCGVGAPNSCTSSPASCDTSQSNICVQGVGRGTNNTPIVGAVELSSDLTGGVGECGISVSFVYPFKFTLPGTSLNNTTVNLRAQAEMRTESQ